MPVPFVGPSYTLNTRKADVQRTVNMFPVANEVAGGKSAAYLESVPGLVVFSGTDKDPTIDEHIGSVQFLSHFNGADGSQDFVDEFGSSMVVTPSGSGLQLSAAFATFGATGAYGTAGRSIYVTELIGVLLQPQFTIEAFIKITAPTISPNPVVALRIATSDGSYSVELYGENSPPRRYFIGRNPFGYLEGPAAEYDVFPWNGRSTHLALTRDAAGVLRLFVDGVLVDSHSGGPATARAITVFRLLEGSQQANAGIDEARFTNGVCRYTADFTVRTTPFPNP